MRCVEYDRFGRAEDVTVVRERAAPQPGPHEVLVRVRAAALNPKDVILRSGKVALLALSGFPKQLGYDFSGEVSRIGRAVKGVREGDAVFGMLQAVRAGTLAEYCVIPEDELCKKPAQLSWEQAAALPLTSLTALQALRDDARARPGQRLLIHGASGGVGVVAIQIAKALSLHVTSVSSAKNKELCLSLGSDAWLDYAQDDLFSGSARYDVIFDVFGNKSLARVKKALVERGQYVSTVPTARVLIDSARSLLRGPRAHLVTVKSRADDLAWLAARVEAGKLRAVIDSVYSLEDAAAAQKRVESKHSRGKVVIRL